MRRIALLILLLMPMLAAAQLPDLPGVSTDAAGYGASMTARFPTGGTAQQRVAAENRAVAAERANNWPQAVVAWEERLGMAEPRPEQYLSLARAQLTRTPPENARALQAAWLNFMAVPGGVAEIPSLLIMAQALQRLDRLPQQLRVLEGVVARAPQEARYVTMLADARRAVGLLVARVTTDVEAEPASACIGFTVAPSQRADWQPADWVRAEPAIPGLSVTREGRQLCVAGLPRGRTTQLVLRAGLPGEDNLRLVRDARVPVAMPNRAPRIAFDNTRYILARGQQARVGLATVNLSALELRLVRVAERSLVPAMRQRGTLDNLEQYEADDVAESFGRVVWEGRAQLAPGEANITQRVVLPLPDVLRAAGPGLFILLARAGDGSGRDRVNPGVLPIFVTDLGLTAWRSPAGLAVQARGLQSGRVQPGTRLALIAANNEILGVAEADADGLARFAGPLLRGTGGTAPQAVHALLGDDFVALNLEAASFDLSDRGASGRAHPGPLDAFVYLDRGIFRPGETVNASVLLRDAAGAPSDVPTRLRLRRPNGQVAAEAVPVREPGAAILWPIPLPNGAPAGNWSLEVLTDPEQPPIATRSFRVDAFVPERLEVRMENAGPLVPGTPLNIPVSVRFLYDAPGEGMTGDAVITLTANRSPFAQWPRFEFGVLDEINNRSQITAAMAETDAQGRGTLVVNVPTITDATQPLSGTVALSVQEPGGRTSSTSMALEVRAQNRMIGLRPGFTEGAVDAGQEAAFEVIALDAAAQAVPATLSWRLLRETPEWRIVLNDGRPRYATIWRSEPVESGTIQTGAQPVPLARSLPFGRYRLEVTEPGTLAITSTRFRSGWASGESVDTPDKVDIAADRNAYAPGDSARIRIQAPFAGVASVAVLTDRLVTMHEVAVPEGGTEVTIPVDAAWGAGAHVAVTVFRPGEARAGHPGRALGLAWLQIDPASRALTVAIEGDARILPRQRIIVPVRVGGAAGEARLTLAAVDEGILRLTRFATPDPLAHYTGRRALGVDIRDDYGRLIAPPEGEAAALRQGGDGDDSLGAIEIPQRNVSLFSGVVRVGADGLAQVPLDIPDFAGELRLMAVAWEGSRLGSAGRALTVRDPLIAEAVLPRFLAPGDEARLPLLLHNLDLPAGMVTVTLAAEGAIALNGPATINQQLAVGQRVTAASGLRATGQGVGVLRLSATGPGGFAVTREARITVRSSRGFITEVAGGEVPAGAERPLPLAVERFVPGSWRASARFGGPVRYDVAGMLSSLESFPLDCTEQAASRVIGLLAAGAWAGEDRGGRLQIAVNSVLNRQRYDGAFSLWSAQGMQSPWLSAYATEALLRARAAGAAVPETALTSALQYLDDAVEEFEDDSPIGLAAQAYRLHALAQGGRVRLGAARRLMENLAQLPTPLARAQLGAALAAGRDIARAEQAFLAALEAPNRRFWHLDYGSAARDWLAIAVLFSESGVLPARMNEVRSRIPGPEFTPAGANTQEKAWALLAASVLGRDGRPVRVALNGTALEPPATLIVAPVTGPATMRNNGDGPVWATTSITGIPLTALPAGRNAMRIARRFFTLTGQPLNLDQLRSGTAFILQLEGRADTGQDHAAMVQQGLPAGWEVQARLPAGDVQGMPWVGTLSEPASTPALDDRVSAAIDLTTQEQTFRLAWRVRATTPGRYELPGAELADMYRPELFARQAAARITVLE